MNDEPVDPKLLIRVIHVLFLVNSSVGCQEGIVKERICVLSKLSKLVNSRLKCLKFK